MLQRGHHVSKKKTLINYSDKEYRRDENMRMKINGIKVENENLKILEEKQFISKSKICSFCCVLCFCMFRRVGIERMCNIEHKHYNKCDKRKN